MKDLTLVILAAGMGSRFGGLKQIEPVGPNGEFIIDYSVYDAIKAGFTKIVFVIKKENYDVFKETIGKRVEDKIKVVYAFQDLGDIPEGFTIPEGRVKPWGTAHAILAAKNYVDGNFAIINADDFYGRDAYMTLGQFLKNNITDSKEHFCMIGYQVKNTMTENGSVKRGVCEETDGYLNNLIESKVEKINNEIIATPLDGRALFTIEDDTLVSMNMFGFTQKIMSYLQENFSNFLRENIDNPLTCEYLIPDIVFKGIAENSWDVRVLKTTSRWYGVTYKEDKEGVVTAIKKLVEDGIYPNNLWK